MRNLILILVLIMMASCGLWEKSKPTFVDKVASQAKKAGVKYLECKTGEAIELDIKREMDKLLKVKRKEKVSRNKSLASSTLGKTACNVAVETILPLLVVQLGNQYVMPKSWQEDECNMQKLNNSLKTMASKFCGDL